MVYGVRISPYPIAGLGLFAERSRGEWIVPYSGRVLTWRQLESMYPSNTLAPYVEQVSDNMYIDAACVRSIGSLANGAAEAKRSNAETSWRGGSGARGGLWLWARRGIREGEEIINHYGESYFEEPVSAEDGKTVRHSV